MPAPPFNRILIANRGEIAVRVIRACDSLGIESVVAVSAADRDSLAASLATRAVCIGPAPAAQSYLRPEFLITAAQGTQCQAIHPGYGFLSERAQFSRMCAKEGLTFIGPSPEAIEAMGDKLSAVQLAEQAGVPRVPGSGRIEDAANARDFARRHGFPILIKASAGGGGRGMRIVRREADIAHEIDAAAAEAKAAFGDPSLYVEKFIERARHIEIQVLGDSHGNVVHLGERDCSTQRRHQKLIEEAPSPAIDAKLREELAGAAVRLARLVNYVGAGTVEFVFDADTSRDVQLTGHAIECRINAEDATQNFAPRPGRLQTWAAPSGEGIRVDTHCFSGYLIPPYYDSLLAKVITHGADRQQALQRMSSALADLKITGVPTTAPFHQQVLAQDDFRSAKVTTRWVEETFLPAANAERSAT